jgi:7-cyano-7-deazaguanine reductase
MRLVLETLENSNAGKGYVIRLDTAEVVSRCPMTGLPDYYRVTITYEPDALLVELKSLKLYFVEFLDRRTLHEDLLNTVVDDLVADVSPKWVHVLVAANVRGGIEASLSRFWSSDEGDEIGTAVEMMLESP